MSFDVPIITSIFTETNISGSLKKFTEEIFDLDNNFLSKRVTNYTYYPSGEVDWIILDSYVYDVLVSRKRVKHFKSGKQPHVILITY